MDTCISVSNPFSCKTTANCSHRGHGLLDGICLEKTLILAVQSASNALFLESAETAEKFKPNSKGYQNCAWFLSWNSTPEVQIVMKWHFFGSWRYLMKSRLWLLNRYRAKWPTFARNALFLVKSVGNEARIPLVGENSVIQWCHCCQPLCLTWAPKEDHSFPLCLANSWTFYGAFERFGWLVFLVLGFCLVSY